MAFGGSIPQLDPKHVQKLLVPWPAQDKRSAVARPVVEAWDLQDQADAHGAEAIALIERAIEAG